jgi:uncharacterized membrane protein YbhN (UPF0104 family)
MTTPPRAGGVPERALRRGAAVLVAAGAAVVAAVVLAPGLERVQRLLEGTSPGWVAAAVLLEVGSCLGFVAVVVSLFELPRAHARKLGWAELAVNVLLPAGGVSGLGVAGWMLHRRGMTAGAVALRSAAMFVFTSLPNFVAVAVLGPAMWLGLLAGARAWELTLAPALLASLAIAAGALAARARRPPTLAAAPRRAALARVALGAFREAGSHVRWRDRGLWGSFAYWASDNAVLVAGLWAVGDHPPIGVVLMAYLLGQLASLLPVPGGLGAAEGGLIGMLALFGVAAAPATAAVLLYRAVALWVPVLGGAVAFAGLRREASTARRRAWATSAARCATRSRGGRRRRTPGSARDR